MANDSVPISEFSSNHILSTLSPEEVERLRPHLEPIELPSGKVLFRPDETIEYVYFPENGMVSVVAYTEDGHGAEVGVIGREGFAGMDVVMGSDTTLNEHMIQMPDRGWRMKTSVIREEFERCSDFQQSILEFVRLMMLQVSQTALCNRLHSVEQRLSRWLLMCHDRSGSDLLSLTQEFLGIMLGSNRTTVTQAAIELQDRNLIEYNRGKITVKDRKGLEKTACDCYQNVRHEESAVAE